MGVRNLFYKPLQLEYALLFFGLWKLLKLYALSRQLCLVKKELAGEKKVVTNLARKDDENYKRTLALLKPYLTSAAYHKTLEYSKDRLKLYFVFELFHLFATVVFVLNVTPLKFWHFAGRLYSHKCHYSHVFAYVVVRLGFSYLWRFPFRYYGTYLLEKKHGLKTKSRFMFVKQYLLCYFFYVTVVVTLVSGFTWLNQLSREHFTWNAVAFTVVAGFVLVWVTPYLLKLFYEMGPLNDLELRKEVDAMGKRLGLSSKDVHVVSSSHVTYLVNLSWGFCKFKNVYLNEAYVSLGKPSALALVAHSFGHFKHHHFFKYFLFKLLKLVVFVFAFNHFKRNTALFKSFGTHSVSALVLRLDTFTAVFFPVLVLFYVLRNVYCHFLEFEADRYAVKLGHTDELVNFWTAVYRERRLFFNVDPLYGPLFAEKPSLFERVYAAFDATVTPKAGSN